MNRTRIVDDTKNQTDVGIKLRDAACLFGAARPFFDQRSQLEIDILRPFRRYRFFPQSTRAAGPAEKIEDRLSLVVVLRLDGSNTSIADHQAHSRLFTLHFKCSAQTLGQPQHLRSGDVAEISLQDRRHVESLSERTRGDPQSGRESG